MMELDFLGLSSGFPKSKLKDELFIRPEFWLKFWVRSIMSPEPWTYHSHFSDLDWILTLQCHGWNSSGKKLHLSCCPRSCKRKYSSACLAYGTLQWWISYLYFVEGNLNFQWTYPWRLSPFLKRGFGGRWSRCPKSWTSLGIRIKIFGSYLCGLILYVLSCVWKCQTTLCFGQIALGRPWFITANILN